MRNPRLGLAALLAVLLAAGIAAVVLVPGRSHQRAAPPAGRPSSAPPAPITSLAPLAATAPMPTPAGVARSVAALLAVPSLGGLHAAVLDVATGQPLLGPDNAVVTPASTAKLVTAAAALATLGPTARLTTTAVAGATPSTVVVVGAGDPSLAGPAAPPGYPPVARLTDLAAGIANAGVRRVDTVVVDTSLFAGPSAAPGWKPSYFTDGDVAPVGALMVDYGQVRPGHDPRVDNPALTAGRDLLALLPGYGVTVSPGARVTGGVAPPGARQLAAVSSPPLADLVELMLRTSNNDLAEALARLVAIHEGKPGTFAAGAAAIMAEAARLGVPTAGMRLVDGSGLSRDDRVRPVALAQLLRIAASAGQPALRSVLTGLPVAGFAGTLIHRYDAAAEAAGAGMVRAKTGTLTGVSALAGLVVDADGRLLAFDVTADNVPSGRLTAAETALDRVAATLATCGCR